MKSIVAAILLVAVCVNGQEHNTTKNDFVCVQGTRLFVEGSVILDNSTALNCRGAEDSCAVYVTVVDTPEGYVAVSETGICVITAYKANYTCDGVSEYLRPNDTLLNCTRKFCDGFACNTLKTPKTCKETPEDDIQILPRCTMRQALDKVMTCMEPLFSGYPYSNQMMCARNLDNTIACMSDAAVECLGGSCPTVLDEIPNLRNIYRGVVVEAKKYKTLESILDMFGADEKTKKMILTAVCPVPGETPSLPDMSGMLGDMSGMLEGMEGFEIPFCDGEYMTEMMKVQVEAMKAFYNVQTRSDFCMAFTMFGIRMGKLWENHCSVEKMEEFLRTVLTGHNEKYVDLIMKAMGIMYDYFSKLQLPNCGAMMTMPCDHFHESGRACDLRKGWMCDYVHWKINFLDEWMGKIMEWKKNNIVIDMPEEMEQQECLLGWTDHLCVDDSKMRCVSAAGGCPLCFCSDHEYRDVGAVAKMWRMDYKLWYGIMQKYKAFFSNDMC